MPNLDDCLARLRRNRFVSIGRAGLDLYPEPPGTRVEDAATFRADLGGSAGNIAVALARLGASVQLVSCFSDDAVGGFARARLQEYGVDTSLCRTVGGEARTSLAIAETRPVDSRTVIYRNGAADFELAEADVAAIDFAGTGGIIVSGTALAREPSRAAVRRAMTQAGESGAPIVLDLDFRAYSWTSPQEAHRIYAEAAERSDMVVGNEDEFGVVAGGGIDPRRAAEALSTRRPAVVVFKMGDKGAVTFSNGRSFRTGVFPAEPLKPFGAGDAFMAGLLSALAEGRSLEDAVGRGSAAAAMVVSRVGCASAMPTRNELDAFVADNATASRIETTHARSTV